MSALHASKITLYSIAVKGLARAANVALLLSDAGVKFTEEAHQLSKWPEARRKLREPDQATDSLQSNPYGAAPTLEIDNRRYAQTMPILRYLARELGAYDGTSHQDMYTVDAVADIAIDWRTDWVACRWTDDPAVHKRYRERKLPRFVRAIEGYIKRSGGTGPFLLGERFTYADIAVYTLVYDETPLKCGVSDGSPLYQLYSAVGMRPGIAAYIKEWEKRGLKLEVD